SAIASDARRHNGRNGTDPRRRTTVVHPGVTLPGRVRLTYCRRRAFRMGIDGTLHRRQDSPSQTRRRADQVAVPAYFLRPDRRGEDDGLPRIVHWSGPDGLAGGDLARVAARDEGG